MSSDPISSPAPRAANAPLPFFEEANVTVSTARIVVYGTPFPLKDARSVRVFVDQPHRRFAVPILVVAILVAIYGIVIRSSPTIAIGVMLAVVSYLTWKFQTMRHRVLVVRDAGETEVLATSDLGFAKRVAAALEQAVALAPTPSAARAAAPPTA
ncbi:DUF6232 family protein [Robbsia sp. Bb-Pol-6]|uniref:DUF6232 family protein n=1 Tax=Robbsia betulipollinis TaxID=2981849 RepID=A0ABT3ZML7_9BURK|nr:DUF6232 family protein [Robbsia betulipollinis]MCY0387801.1 DUF6232 family protein [Robbsia betulipollinis]